MSSGFKRDSFVAQPADVLRDRPRPIIEQPGVQTDHLLQGLTPGPELWFPPLPWPGNRASFRRGAVRTPRAERAPAPQFDHASTPDRAPCGRTAANRVDRLLDRRPPATPTANHHLELVGGGARIDRWNSDRTGPRANRPSGVRSSKRGSIRSPFPAPPGAEPPPAGPSRTRPPFRVTIATFSAGSPSPPSLRLRQGNLPARTSRQAATSRCRCAVGPSGSRFHRWRAPRSAGRQTAGLGADGGSCPSASNGVMSFFPRCPCSEYAE